MKAFSNRPQQLDLAYRFLINGLTAFLVAIFIFFGIYYPFRWIFAAAASAIAAVALWEYGQLVKKKELHPAIALGIVAMILYIFAIFVKTQDFFSLWEPFWHQLPEIILGLTFLSCFIYFFIVGKSPITNISTTFFGIIYIGIPLGTIIRILYLFTFLGMEVNPYMGTWWIIYLFLVTKSGDVGGYFFGRYLGKRKLAVNLSPNKTLEGSLGALLASTVVSLLLCVLARTVFEKFTYIQSLWLGILIGVLGQVGDLAESFLKRDANVKDSNTIPGVGGILDMVDSLLFTAPVVYIFLRILYT
ncbi:MAG: phosphatidate cytidylyltransferase [Chlamydiales bacterium]